MVAVSSHIKNDLRTENELTFLIGKSITKDGSYFSLSLDSVQDASSHFLNDFLRDRLAAVGITSDFTYQLISRDSTYYLHSPKRFKKEDNIVVFPLELEGYLPKLIGESLFLELHFTDMNAFFLYQLNGLTIPSLIFMFAIILVVVWVLKSFYWQRKVITTTNEFINNLTHELKTPVFSIGLATKLLEQEDVATQKPVIKLIRAQVDRLKNHIDKVLDLASLEGGKRVFTLTTLDFYPNLKNICKEFEAITHLEDVRFEYDLKGEHYRIKAEASHLENAINNVLDNAKKYSDNSKILLNTTVRNKKLLICITDNGTGIAQKEQRLIFQKYYRVVDGNLHKVKGYGLGLSYVKNVVKNHRGKISLDSELGKGTSVVIELPLVSHG
ncbi:sensor histidine kinase [Cellulophaga sp. Z1A5H]|uniref:sensor histidine kinase n=1 Tax=Cellulophaga sp. Z1A5H TaxID=2687291 RepID=UPI001F112439|nr:HAMP domain-containing sensor histidine kinase [Cellulophaga sp. Z1A5H]